MSVEENVLAAGPPGAVQNTYHAGGSGYMGVSGQGAGRALRLRPEPRKNAGFGPSGVDR